VRSGLLLAAVTVVICLLVAEMALRLRTSASLLWHYPNFIQLDLRSDESERPQLRYDSMLGWDLQPGASGLLAGKPNSISADGMRNHTPVSGPAAARRSWHWAIPTPKASQWRTTRPGPPISNATPADVSWPAACAITASIR
jgi:hypothetical protein